VIVHPVVGAGVGVVGAGAGAGVPEPPVEAKPLVAVPPARSAKAVAQSANAARLRGTTLSFVFLIPE
jgi:hypothetical protein